MPTQIINLGQVSSIFKGVNPPSNTSLIWYDETPLVKKHKYYDTISSTWVLLSESVGGKILMWNSTDAAAGEYGTNIFVSYLNKIWRSEVNSNTSIPGTDINWIEQGFQKYTGVAGTYGGSDKAIDITVDSYGRISSVSESNILITASQVSDFNTAADARITLQRGFANGLASLDAGGKVPMSQLPSTILIYKGVWDLSTNTPTLSDGTSTTGWTYRVTGAPTPTNFNFGSGNILLTNGDYIIYNDSAVWEKSDGSDAVTSVNGYQGVVSLTTDDIAEDGSPTNLWFTQARTINSVLSGYVSGSGIVSSSDSILQAIQKLNGNVTAISSSISGTTGTLALFGASNSLGNSIITQSGGTISIAGNTTASGLINTTAGNGISAGGNSFAIAPSATRGVININGSTDQFLTFSTQSYIYNGTTFRMLSTSDIDFVAGGVQRLLISSSTGAATFSSSVSVGGDITMTINATIRTIWNSGYGGAVQLLRSDATTTRWARIGIVNNSGVWVGGLQIDSDTTATFSSSVTIATDLIVDTNTLYVDSTLNKVGIGIAPSSSSTKFDVYQGIINSSSTYGFSLGISGALPNGSAGWYHTDGATTGFSHFYANKGGVRIGVEGNVNSLDIVKTTGAATFSSSVTAASLIKAGSSDSYFLLGGGGHVAISTYLTANQNITLSGEVSGSGTTSITTTLLNSAVIGKVLTGLSITGSTISSSDSILSAFGKLQNQLNGLSGGLVYKGSWNANTNTPTLANGTGTTGWLYIVNVAGTQNLGTGAITFGIGDWVIYNGTVWEKVSNTDSVTSVNGAIGAVTLTTLDIAENTNLYFTNARAITSTLTGYTSGSGTISSSDTILQAIQKLNGNIVAATTTIGTTSIALNGTSTTLVGLASVTSTSFVGTLTGNASTATTLQTSRNINGVAFNGSANITVTADASTLTGTVLNSSVVTSSLTSVGTITSGTWNGSVITDTYISSASSWNTAYSNRITSLTTTGSSGSSTLLTNVLNIPTYTLAGLGGQPLATNLTSLSGLSYVSTSFVKMTAAGTFTLDTNTYLTTTSAASTYLALSGGTLTGALSGTAATFTSNLLVGGYIKQNTLNTDLRISANGTGFLSLNYDGGSGGVRISDGGGSAVIMSVDLANGLYINPINDATISYSDNKFLVSDFGTVKYLNAANMLTKLGAAPSTGGTGYIQNRTGSAQTTSNFWISGDGRVDGRVYVGTHGAYFEEVAIGADYRIKVVDSNGNSYVL